MKYGMMTILAGAIVTLVSVAVAQSFPKWWDNPEFALHMTDHDRVVARQCFEQAGFKDGESNEEFTKRIRQHTLCIYQLASPGFAAYMRSIGAVR